MNDSSLIINSGDMSSSLPLLTDLLKVQSSHVASLEKKKKKLQLLEESMKKEELVHVKLKDDVVKVCQALQLQQGKEIELKYNCTAKQNRLEILLSKTNQLKHLLADMQEERLEEESAYTEYRNKMSEYIRKLSNGVTCYTRETDALQDEIVAAMKQRQEKQKDGTKLEDINSQIKATTRDKEMVVQENDKLLYKVDQGEKTIAGLSSELRVAKKRSHAQLTRLRHQLQEAQCKRKQWIEEKTQLTVVITKINQLSEE